MTAAVPRSLTPVCTCPQLGAAGLALAAWRPIGRGLSTLHSDFQTLVLPHRPRSTLAPPLSGSRVRLVPDRGSRPPCCAPARRRLAERPTRAVRAQSPAHSRREFGRWTLGRPERSPRSRGDCRQSGWLSTGSARLRRVAPSGSTPSHDRDTDQAAPARRRAEASGSTAARSSPGRA